MAESAIKSNQREAAVLFQRGVAAARGGQRRVAAGLLGRAVQLDPHNELGWLWLSGVLDEPDEIAFCLRSVLTVNPHNERARQGLIWLEQRGLVTAQPAPETQPALEAVAEPYRAEEERGVGGRIRREAESWWVNWRHTHRDMSRARLVLWGAAIVVLLLTLGVNFLLRAAVEERAIAQARAVVMPTATAIPTVPALPPILQVELSPARDARVLAYLSALDAPRAALREAVRTYQDATSQPGGSSITHAAAARKLRDEIDTAYSVIERLMPPPALAQAHASYLAGLELERSALDDMLNFYGSFSLQLANRAALRMEDADKQLERARTMFKTNQAQIAVRAIHPQTAR